MENRGTNPRRRTRASGLRFHLGTLVLGAGLLSGCEWLTQMDDAMPPSACASMDGCPSGFLCVDNFCRQVCTSSATCNPGEVCAPQETLRACVPQPPDAGSESASLGEASVPGDASPDESSNADDASMLAEEAATDVGASPVDASTRDAAGTGDATVADASLDASDARTTASPYPVDTGPAAPWKDGGCPAPSRVVLFSGLDQLSNTVQSDTWQWNGATWTLVDADAGSADAGGGPNPRYLASMGSICGRAVLFGGNDGSETWFDDQWSWDGVSWAPIQVDGGAPMQTESAATATFKDALVLFGGITLNIPALSDTWIFGGVDWTHVVVQGKPTARSAAAMAPIQDGLLLIGGTDVNSFVLADAWTWNGVNWLTASPPPVPLWGASAAALGGTVVLFGGNDIAGTPRGETWVWDGSTWTNAMPAHSPPARYFASIATLGSAVVLFGGADDTQDFADTWTWDGTDWTDTQQIGPSRRDGAMMTAF